MWNYNTGTGASAAAQLNAAAIAGSGGSSAVQVAQEVWGYATRDITGGTIDTNNDKTGYSLTQSFPTNFDLLSINGSGEVVASNAGSGGSSSIEIAETVWSYVTRDITGGEIDTNNDKTGYSLTQNFPANFEDLSITATTGLVTTSNPGTGSSSTTEIAETVWAYATRDITGGEIDTNNDKTGYSLTQAFPTNFDLLSINGTGEVVASNAGSGGSSAVEVANAVWSFDISTGPASPSASYYIDNINTNASSAATDASTAASNTNDIGGTVWGTDVSAYTSPSAGFDLANAGSGGSSSVEIAGEVWSYATRDITGGEIDTNNDKTGYSLTQSFPTNFDLLSINGSGEVVASNAGSGGSSAIQVAEEVWGYATRDITGGEIDTNNDKTGYSLTQNFPANFEDLSITATTGLVTTSNPGTGSTATPQDVAAATWTYGSGRTITGGTGVTLATSLPSNFSTLNIDGTGKVSVQSADITTIKSGLSTLTQAQVGTEVDSSLSDVGLTSTVTGRIDAAISSRLASASAPVNFSTLSINGSGEVVTSNPGTGSTATVQQVAAAVWTANRASIGASDGQFGYYLNAPVSAAGGTVTQVMLGPFSLAATDGNNGYLNVFVDDERPVELVIVDQNGNAIPLDSNNTHSVLVYDSGSTLVATYTGTVEYEAGGIVSFPLDADVTGTAGSYRVVFDIDNGLTISKYGGLTILVRLC